jgi:hypothetical protein
MDVSSSMPQIYLTGFQPTQAALLMKGTAGKDNYRQTSFRAL